MSSGRRVRGLSRTVAALALASAGLAACGDDGVTPSDAAVDAAADAAIDTPATVAITGEIVDWDATSAMFCGVANAKVTVRGAPTVTDTTSPNGRFELNVTPQALNLFDVAFNLVPSECTVPKDTYPHATVFVADRAMLEGQLVLSARAMTGTRRDTMFTQIGTAYSAVRAQLVVHVTGAATPVTISAPHDATQAFDGTTWRAGESGSDVFFPNAAPGVTRVSIQGKTYDVTLEADVFTSLTVSSAVSAAAR